MRTAPAAPLVRIPLDLAYRSPSLLEPLAVPTEVADPTAFGVAEEVLPAALAEGAPGAGSHRAYGLVQR
jgi:hypothetical protein